MSHSTSSLAMHALFRHRTWLLNILLFGIIGFAVCPRNLTAQPNLGNFTVSPTPLPATPNGVLATGVVLNQYAVLASNAISGSSTLTVTDITHFSASSPFSTTLGTDDLLLVIQMQGASINTQNNSNYGNVTSYNNCGNYEFVYVQSVAGNTVTLKCNLKNNYTASGKVQVIRVPVFNNLTVDNGAVITSIPWNYIGPVNRGTSLPNPTLSPNLPVIPTGGQAFPAANNRGGIVAIQVLGTLTLNGTGKIDVTGHGFRGGVIDGLSSPSGPLIFNYYVTNSTAEGAAKGESIAGFDLELAAFGGAYGRGAPANGGGGGNGHNAAGGGGANGYNGIARNRGAGIMSLDNPTWAQAWALDPDFIANGGLITTNSGGGRGGYSYGSGNANALTQGPSNTAWGGDQRDPTGGFGGYSLINDPDNRIFFGGGGGAGDNNSNAGERAGYGGGIAYVKADIISGTGSIVVDGEDGPSTRCCGGSLGQGNDGASGGGGGGTLLLNANTLATTVTLSATGGDGGDQNISLGNESEGAGGGGGGGYIGATVSLLSNPVSVAGGAYGTSNSPSLTEFTPNGATSGASGLIEHSSLSATSFPIYAAACDQDNDDDTIVDITDVDDDNDGIPDAYDVCTGATSNTDFPCLNAILHISGVGLDPTKDNDSDGILNYLDKTPAPGGTNTCTDANADGICDATNTIFDSDRDGVPNFYDLDSDNDGITDLIEAGGVDLNGDGIISYLKDNGADNRFELDANENGILGGGENTPADQDGDGLMRTYDATDGGVLLTLPDTDGDGLKDFLDLDSDNDGIPDVIEMGGIDGDGNGQPDALPNGDSDGYTDIFDSDIDGVLGRDITGTGRPLVRTGTDIGIDGVPDSYTVGKNSDAGIEASILLNYRDLDSDADGIPDLVEHRGSDDNNDGKVDNTTDADLDGFADEYDSDDDGVAGIDAGENADPLVITAFDTDFNGKNAEGFTTGDIDKDIVANSWDLDSDDDGLPDMVEAQGFTDSDFDADPATIIFDGDQDFDGRPDAVNTDADNDGWFDAFETSRILEPNADNNPANGKIDRTEGYAAISGFNPNFDGDIQADPYDMDSDNDGILDIDELQPSAMGALPNQPGLYGTDGWETGLKGAYAFNPEESGDGQDDYRDIDAEGDLARDWVEGFYDGTANDQDALIEYKAKAVAWITAICGTHPGCTAYGSTDADADGFPAWLDSDEANASSNPYPNYNYLPPFLNVASTFYMDVDEDGLVDLFDKDYAGVQSSEPDDAGAATQSLLTPTSAGAGSGVPAYRDNLINVTLPVEWELVELSRDNANSMLYWKMSSEEKLAHYQVERSLTGLEHSFESLGSIIPVSGEGMVYSYTDVNAMNLPATRLYYRVRAAGQNGGGSYSKTLTISPYRQEVHMKAYPNPAHENLTVETSLQEDATLSLVSVIGQTVLSVPVRAGTTAQNLSVSNIPSGLYLLVLSDGSAHVPVMVH